MSDLNQAIRDVVKGASVIYVGLFLELLIAFLAQILAARYLSVGDFGGLTVGTALLDIGAIVAGLGLANGLTRYLPRTEASEKRMLAFIAVGTTLVTSAVLGAAIVLNASFIASAVFGSPNVTVSVGIFGAAIPFAALLNVAVGGIRGQERSVDWVVVKNIVHPLARITLVVGAVLYGLEQAGLAGAYAVPYAISAVVALVLLHRSLPHSRAPFDRDRVEEVVRYSLPFTLTSLSTFVYRSVDIFLILYFLGDTETGIYGVAFAAVSFMRMFSTATGFLSTPIASRLEGDRAIEDVMELFRSVVRWLIIASTCALVPLGVFAGDFIAAIYTSKYASGGPVLLILAVGFAFDNVLSIHNSILEAVGRSKTLSVNMTAAAVLNLALNLVLIPTYGIIGAAVATTAAYFLRDGLATVQVHRTLTEVPLTWKAIRPVSLAVPFLLFVWFVVAPATPKTFVWLVVVTALTTAAFLAAVLLVLGLSETEVMILLSAEERYGLEATRLGWLIRRLVDR